jgi:hypothetical protein
MKCRMNHYRVRIAPTFHNKQFVVDTSDEYIVPQFSKTMEPQEVPTELFGGEVIVTISPTLYPRESAVTPLKTIVRYQDPLIKTF